MKKANKAIEHLELMNLELKDKFESLKSDYDDVFSKFYAKSEEELECPISHIKMEPPSIILSGRSIEHAKLDELYEYNFPDSFDPTQITQGCGNIFLIITKPLFSKARIY